MISIIRCHSFVYKDVLYIRHILLWCLHLIALYYHIQKAFIRFTFFDLEYDLGCNNDFLGIYDGRTTQLVAKLCGTGCKGTEIVTPSNKVKIFFQSNGNITGRGFVMKFRRTKLCR